MTATALRAVDPVARRAEATEALEACNDRIEKALEAGDVDAIAEAVTARGPVIEALIAAHDASPLPEGERKALAAREADLQERMLRHLDAVQLALRGSRQRTAAMKRYARET